MESFVLGIRPKEMVGGFRVDVDDDDVMMGKWCVRVGERVFCADGYGWKDRCGWMEG